MDAKRRILVIGSANMDLSLNMYKLPEPGQTVTDDGGVAYTPGGKGANAAVAFKRLGDESVFCAKLGADLHGQKLFAYYKDTGINTAYIKADHTFPTGFAAVMKESDGQNRIVYYPGANIHITNEAVREAFRCAPHAVYLGFESSFDTALTAARIADTEGIPVFLDAAPASKSYPLEALPRLEIFSPNETETFEYTGVMPAGADSSLRAALELHKRVKCKYIVIKQGERGAFIYDGKHYHMIPPYRPDRLTDSTAAGDVFGAALLHEYLRTGDIIASANYAAAAGAIAVSRPGASESAPTDDEVRRFMARHTMR